MNCSPKSRQQIMQISMFFSAAPSSRKQRSTWSQKLDTTYRFFLTHMTYRQDLWISSSQSKNICCWSFLEGFQHNVLHESSGAMNQSCLEHHHNSHRTHGQFKNMFPDMLWPIAWLKPRTKKVNVIMPCVTSFLQALHRKEFEEELLQYQAKVRKWMHAQRRCTMNWETLWLLRVHGHRQKWFSAELVKRTQWKKKVFVHLWVVLQESSARKIKHVETYHSESDDSLKPIAVQDHYTAKHHFWKAQSKRFESRAYRCEQHDYCRKYMRERSRTYETTANCDNIVNALRETHNLRFNEDKRNLGTNEK